MMRFLKLLILIVFAVISVSFSVANRAPVSISLNPFSQNIETIGNFALIYEVPLYLVVFIALMSGIVLGGFSAWIVQGKWRQRARTGELQAVQQKQRAEEAEQKIKELKPAPNKSIPLLP